MSTIVDCEFEKTVGFRYWVMVMSSRLGLVVIGVVFFSPVVT